MLTHFEYFTYFSWIQLLPSVLVLAVRTSRQGALRSHLNAAHRRRRRRRAEYCKHKDMADERGGGEDNINDNMGNQLQLLPGNSWRRQKHRSEFDQLSVYLFIQLTASGHVCTTGHCQRSHPDWHISETCAFTFFSFLAPEWLIKGTKVAPWCV